MPVFNGSILIGLYPFGPICRLLVSFVLDFEGTAIEHQEVPQRVTQNSKKVSIKYTILRSIYKKTDSVIFAAFWVKRNKRE